MSTTPVGGPTDGAAQTPVCPRHPDRPSYVRCQRCSRPACPDCQRPAAVGVQCLDCVAAGAKTVRQGRTVFGGTVTDGRPVVTYGLIAVCVAVWLLELVSPSFTDLVAFRPADGIREPWTLLTSAFAHSPTQPLHIMFNMYALWMLGQYLEPLLGRARFLALYLLAALGGSVAFLLLARPMEPAAQQFSDTAWYTPVVGASGAVFGLFGAFIVLNRRLGVSSAGMYATLAINFVLGFVMAGIAWQAHVGGFLTGLAAAAAIAYSPRGQAQRHWLWLGLLVAVLVAAAVLKYAVSPDPVLVG